MSILSRFNFLVSSKYLRELGGVYKASRSRYRTTYRLWSSLTPSGRIATRKGVRCRSAVRLQPPTACLDVAYESNAQQAQVEVNSTTSPSCHRRNLSVKTY